MNYTRRLVHEEAALMSEDLLYAEDYQAMGRVEVGSWHLTETEIINFAGEWDPFPFHVDPDAARASHFGGLIASGVHVLAILQLLQFRAVMGRTAMVAGLGFKEMRLASPAYAGDTLTAAMEIQEVRLRPDGRAIVRWIGTVHRADDLVLQIDSAAMIRQRSGGPHEVDKASTLATGPLISDGPAGGRQ